MWAIYHHWGLLILAPLSHWSRLAEQNLNCRLNPIPPTFPPFVPEDTRGDKTGKSNSQPSPLSSPFFLPPFTHDGFTSAFVEEEE